MEKIVLASFEYDTTSIAKARDENSRLKQEIIALRKEQADLNSAIKSSGKVTDDQAAKLSKVDAELNQVNKTYQGNLKIINASASSTKELNAALSEEIKTEAQALANIQKLTQARKGVDATTVEGAKQIKILNTRIDENNKFITENSDAYTRQKRNIGNYTDSIKEALAGQGVFNSELNGFSKAMTALSPVFGKIQKDVALISNGYRESAIAAKAAGEAKKAAAAAASLAAEKEAAVSVASEQAIAAARLEATAATRSAAIASEASARAQELSSIASAKAANGFKILKIAIASTGIGLLVIALGSLVSFFGVAQKGVDAFSRVLQPLRILFERVSDVAQVVGENIFDAFNNPKQALADFAEFLKTNIVNRFKAIEEILGGIINLDFRQLFDGILQAGTGVEDLSSKVSKSASETNKFFKEVVDSGLQIAANIKQINTLEANQLKTRAESSKIIAEQEEIAKNINLSLKDRQAAIDIALKTSEKELAREKEILALKLKNLQIEQGENTNITKEIAQQNELKAQIIDKDREQVELRLKFGRVGRSIAKEVKDQANEEIEARKAAGQAAIEADKKRKESAIANMKEELELFQFTFNRKTATSEQLIEFEKDLSDKRLEILDAENSAGLQSKVGYELEKQKIAADFLVANTQILLDAAQNEIRIFEATNKSQVGFNKLLSDEIINNEEERIASLLEKNQKYLQLKRDGGLISEVQFQSELSKLDADAEAKRIELQQIRRQQDEDANAIDLENLIAFRTLSGESEFVLRQDQLERERLLEIAAAEAVGADLLLINKKYELLKSKLTREENQSRVNQTIAALDSINGSIASVAGESKEVSSVLALVNTLAGINSVFADPSIPTFAGKLLAAASVAASGFANVARINEIEFKDGGGLDGIANGPSHNDGGMLFTVRNRPNFVGEYEGGEFIVNGRSTKKYRPLLEKINSDRFNSGGLISLPRSQRASESIVTNGMTPEQVMTAIESRVTRLEVINLASETYRVATNEIRVRNEAIR